MLTYLGFGTVVELSLPPRDDIAEVSTCHKVLEAEVLLILAAKLHDMCKSYVHHVRVRFHSYCLVLLARRVQVRNTRERPPQRWR